MTMPPRIARDPIDNDELLITAIDTGDAPLIENLLSGALDPNKKLCNGYTPLAYLLYVYRQGGMHEDKVSQIRAAIEANEISRVHSNVTFSYSIKDDAVTPRTTKVAELLDRRSVWNESDVARQLRNWDRMDKLIWLHVGMTCGQFIITIFRKFAIEGSSEFDENLCRFITNSLRPTPYIGDQLLKQRDHGYSNGCMPSRYPKSTFLVFPCLVLATQAKMEERRQSHQEVTHALDQLWGESTGDCQPTGFLQLDHTLDETYYPSLSASRAVDLNKDQVMSRESQKNAKQVNGECTPILMVPQLWIWRTGRCVVTAYSMASPEANAEDPKYDQNFSFELQTNSPDLQIGLILAHHIESFGEKTRSADADTFSSPLDVFESAVLSCMADVDEYLSSPSDPGDKVKEYTFIHSIADVRHELIMIGEIIQEQYKIVETFLADAEREPPEAQSRPQVKATKTRDDTKQPTDEGVGLYIITETANGDTNTQRPAEESKAESVESYDTDEDCEWLKVEAALTQLQQYQNRIKKIDRNAERMEKSIQDKLKLKRAHTKIKDAHNSLILSMAVVGFTVITVIFAPLSFLTALFALEVQGFDNLKVTESLLDGSPTRVYSSGKLAGIFVGSEILTFAITGGAMWFSLWFLRRWEMIQEETHSLRKHIAKETPETPTTDHPNLGSREEKISNEAGEAV
ncbi:hypothetical protein F5Y04DRAFT_126082 [Hypomontagnella monticulosa]|nr:hypothetical protein F5Y04DRAFT_126082 [Hypomontagnella monticulosa]